MNRLKSGTITAGILLVAAGAALAQPDIDQTCATCSRRANDSLNLQVRNIRLNQAGYLPQDQNKSAMVANPGSETFSIVDDATQNPSSPAP